jgi:hypothetical protein
MPRKMAGSDPSPTGRTAGGVGNRLHPGSGLQEGPKNDNNHGRSDVIQEIAA